MEETVARALRERGLATRVVALSAYGDERLVRGMLEAGAVGYVLKDEPVEAILGAVRAAMEGRAYFSPEVAVKRVAWARGERPGGLTERELEVPRRVAEEKSNKEISGLLGISENTVEKHIGHILEELGVSIRPGSSNVGSAE